MNVIADHRLDTVRIESRTEPPESRESLLVRLALAQIEARITWHICVAGFILFLGNTMTSVALAIALALP